MFKQEFSILVILAVMVVITAVLQNNFFEQKAFVRMLNSFIPLMLMTAGQAVVVISGGIDLSAGTSLSLLICILTGVMKKDDPVSGVWALLITAAAAVVIGIINGIGIGYLRLPPVIITFATSYIWLGAALFIRPTPGGQSVNWFRAFYDFGAVEGMPDFIKEFGKVIPPALLLLIIAGVAWFFFNKTRTARYIYAVWSNNDSAYQSGINTARIQTVATVINALFIFLTALYFVGQNSSGDARLGDPLTLRAIAAVFVGGVALSGGRGSVYYAMVGALILSFVNKIVFFAEIPNEYQTLVNGVIVLLALALSLLYNLFTRKAMVKEGLVR